jgi:glucosamine kinase
MQVMITALQADSLAGRTMSKFVAIDAGGTNTRCWVADEERVLGRASTGTVKVMNVGEKVATERLVELVRAAALDAGVGLDEITRTCIGLAGISSGSVKRWGEETLRSVVSGDVVVVGDEDIAMEAAFQGGAGVFLIAGTGAIMSGRCVDGQKFVAGGFGPVLGDEGSGGWIGWEAVRAALRAEDRGEKSCVLDEVLVFWGLHSRGELIAKGNDVMRAHFSELTGVVAQCAERGDAVALDVLERAGVHLAEQVLLVMKKMKEAGCSEKDYLRLAFTGSAVGKIRIVRETMARRLREVVAAIEIPEEEVNAVEGALWLARSRGWA